MARIIDADGHIVEPRKLWEEYVEPEFRDSVIRVEPAAKDSMSSGLTASGGVALAARSSRQLFLAVISAPNGPAPPAGKTSCRAVGIRTRGSK
jgi:hypothetical protein